MARKRAEAAAEQAPEGDQPNPQMTPETSPEAASMLPEEPGDASRPGERQPSTIQGKLEQARKKLARMEETNKICFRHQDDLGAIEDALAKFKYGDDELAHIMEPKGRKMIPGYSFSELEKQKQYINFLHSRVEKTVGGHAAAEEHRTHGAPGQGH